MPSCTSLKGDNYSASLYAVHYTLQDGEKPRSYDSKMATPWAAFFVAKGYAKNVRRCHRLNLNDAVLGTSVVVLHVNIIPYFAKVSRQKNVANR